jgi:hypothetical protein
LRTLSTTLLAAQKSSARFPYVRVEVKERVGRVIRLNWTRLYSGSEPDFYHAATMPGDGSLLRARVDSSDYQLYYQRVANPGPGSDFSAWSSFGPVSSLSGITLASSGATVLLFYVGPAFKTIYCRESTDYGQSFGSPAVVASADSVVGWLAAALNGQSVVALFYSVDGTVYVVKRSVGTWGSPSGWSNSLALVSGLGVVYQGDWNLAVAGQPASGGSGNCGLWTCIYGDGYCQPAGNWSVLKEVIGAGSGSAMEFCCPYLDLPDVFRLFLVEKYTGTQSYSRPLWSHSPPGADFINNLWREPVPFDLSSSYGLALAHSSSQAWLSMPSGVWRSPISQATLDISADLIELSLREVTFGGKARLEFRNDDGRYGGIGSGGYAVIRKGSEVAISPGYRTSAGVEVSLGPAYWISGWQYTSSAGSARFVLEAENGWGLLEAWRARRQFKWAAGQKNILQLLMFILARAGLELTVLSSSSALNNSYPAFALYPGESGALAVRRLLALVPDVLFFRGGCGYIRNPQASDSSNYSYGTGHAVIEGLYASLAQQANRVQVYGSGLMAESFVWSEINDTFDRLRQVHDLNLDSLNKAQQRAEAELRQAQIAATGGEITVPLNCGQELYDVIDITDVRAGLSQAKRRVLGLTWHYVPARGRCEQRLLLGLP